MIQNGEEMRED